MILRVGTDHHVTAMIVLVCFIPHWFLLLGAARVACCSSPDLIVPFSVIFSSLFCHLCIWRLTLLRLSHLLVIDIKLVSAVVFLIFLFLCLSGDPARNHSRVAYISLPQSAEEKETRRMCRCCGVS